MHDSSCFFQNCTYYQDLIMECRGILRFFTIHTNLSSFLSFSLLLYLWTYFCHLFIERGIFLLSLCIHLVLKLSTFRLPSSNFLLWCNLVHFSLNHQIIRYLWRPVEVYNHLLLIQSLLLSIYQFSLMLLTWRAKSLLLWSLILWRSLPLFVSFRIKKIHHIGTLVQYQIFVHSYSNIT